MSIVAGVDFGTLSGADVPMALSRPLRVLCHLSALRF